MKFGKNLLELSIPEWKAHNLQYNHLKSQIKKACEGEISLVTVRDSFVSNFDSINLFVKTKYKEISRKLDFYENSLLRILDSSDTNAVKLIKLDILLSTLVELSVALKKLSKFILIQKIAVKKIFKKFVKKYPDQTASAQTIYNLKLSLNRDNLSFINFSLVTLTMKLTNLINLIKFESSKLSSKDGEDKELELELESVINSKSSLVKDCPLIDFDFKVLMKKNFGLSFLIPDDSSNFNEILLSLNIYLNLRRIHDDPTENSVIYLQNRNSLERKPSFIVSEKGKDISIVISHIGGLREYSYCILPNDIIEIFVKFLFDENDMDSKDKLKEYFKDNKVTSLTKLTIDSILNNGLKPILKTYGKVLRYILDPLQPKSSSAFPVNNHEEYLLTLEFDKFTTDSFKHICTTKFPDNFLDLDSFPFNYLQIYTNDPSLLNFEKTILTEIKEDHLLVNKFLMNHLNKLPEPIQRLVKNNNSINLFRNFNIYQYMLSSYYNIIPLEVNNHFSNLLGLNLFKNFEDTQRFNDEMDFDTSILKNNSDKILRNQLSLNDLEVRAKQAEAPSNTAPSLLKYQAKQQRFRPKLMKNSSLQSMASSFNLLVFTNDKKTDAFDEVIEYEDNDSLRMFWDEETPQNGSSGSVSNFVLNLLHLKSRLTTGKGFKTSETASLHNSTEFPDYNSIAGSDLLGSNTNSVRSSKSIQNYHYYYEHDKIVSFFYLTMGFLSCFITSVEVGIVFSILKLKETNQFQAWDNIWFFGILLLGSCVSFLCSLIALSLITKRYTRPGWLHYGIIVFSFALICLCFVFTGLLIFI